MRPTSASHRWRETMSILRLGGAALGIASTPLLAAQPAPVPAQIPAAKKVFISNAGVDATSLDILRQAGDVNEPFNRFYAAMKNWGRFDLAGAPSDAELVLEVRFATRLANCKQEPDIRFWPELLSYYETEFEVTILDARTRFILWTLDEPVGIPRLKANWSKTLDKGVASLVDGVRSLAGDAAK